jgi:hypothetical protein
MCGVRRGKHPYHGVDLGNTIVTGLRNVLQPRCRILYTAICSTMWPLTQGRSRQWPLGASIQHNSDKDNGTLCRRNQPNLPLKRHLIRLVKAYSGLALIGRLFSEVHDLRMHVLMSYSSVRTWDWLGLYRRSAKNEYPEENFLS